MSASKGLNAFYVLSKPSREKRASIIDIIIIDISEAETLVIKKSTTVIASADDEASRSIKRAIAGFLFINPIFKRDFGMAFDKTSIGKPNMPEKTKNKTMLLKDLYLKPNTPIITPPIADKNEITIMNITANIVYDAIFAYIFFMV